MKLSRTNLKRALLTLILLAGIALAFWNFINDNAKRIEQQNEEYIHELTAQRAVSIDTLLAENLSFIKSTAYLYGESLSSPSADVALIRSFEENTVFAMMRFIDARGDNYTSQGLATNLADRAYFQSGMRGESGITYVLQSRVTGERQIGFYAPVRYEGELIGVMVGFYGEDYISHLLEYTLFENEGEGWLCLRDGTVLGSTLAEHDDNFFAYMIASGRSTATEIEELQKALATDQSEIFHFSERGGVTSGDIVALSQVDWLLIRAFPQEAAERINANANREGLYLLAVLIVLFLAYGVFLGVDVYISHKRTIEANRDANYISSGVSELFQSFTLMDLEKHSYRLLAGSFPFKELAPCGNIPDYNRAITDAAGDAEERTLAADFISEEHLKQTLQEENHTSIRIRFGETACYTRNYVVLTRREDGQPKLLLSIAQNVTELYQKEVADRRKLEEALGESERASRAKTEFLFNMSHDLRTPMNAIIGCTELAQRENADAEELKDYIDKIDSSSRHLLALINDILEMSRIESGKMTLNPEPADLPQAIRACCELFQTQMADKGIRYDVRIESAADPYVSFDENRLSRVVLNLISNAWKFTPKGGQVAVDFTQTGREENEALYELRVQDSGIGMSADFMDKLFTPFERERTSTVSKTQGTGLGLSIAKNIIDLMGGEIGCVSQPNEGTSFTVRLRFPIAEQPMSRAASAERPAEVDFSKLRVLLVEDIEINREIAAMVLQEQGCSVDTAENGLQAVEKVEAAAPGDYDLVLMDIQMPIMDGYSAAKAIRSLPDEGKHRIPIIAMTANAFKEDIEMARAAGMNGHIAKPLDMVKMFETMQAVLLGAEDLQTAQP